MALFREYRIIGARGVQHKASVIAFLIVIKPSETIPYVVGLGGTTGESESESLAQVVD